MKIKSLDSIKLNVCYFSLIVLFILILIGFYNFSTSNFTNGRTIFFLDRSIKSGNDETTTKCNPIVNRDAKLGVDYFQIDGQVYPKSLPLYLNYSLNFTCLNENEQLKTILLWNGFFDSASFAYGLGKRQPFADNTCPVVNCEITNDKARLNESHLVLVHMRSSYDKIPIVRNVDQRWVFFLFESPVHSGDYTPLNGVFNFTSTYRLDSDFPRLTGDYQQFVWKENVNFNPMLDFTQNKSNFTTAAAAAIISNCNAQNKRLDYIQELGKYVRVDVYGQCGRSCPSGEDCRKTISNRYWFFLSFENSICRDYISEKFFYTLKYNIVPVVYGGGNYNYFVSVNN